MDDLTNLGNPQNNLHDWEEQNAPHVTLIPDEILAAERRDDPERDFPSPNELPARLPGNVDEASWNN